METLKRKANEWMRHEVEEKSDQQICMNVVVVAIAKSANSTREIIPGNNNNNKQEQRVKEKPEIKMSELQELNENENFYFE